MKKILLSLISAVWMAGSVSTSEHSSVDTSSLDKSSTINWDQPLGGIECEQAVNRYYSDSRKVLLILAERVSNQERETVNQIVNVCEQQLECIAPDLQGNSLSKVCSDLYHRLGYEYDMDKTSFIVLGVGTGVKHAKHFALSWFASDFPSIRTLILSYNELSYPKVNKSRFVRSIFACNPTYTEETDYLGMSESHPPIHVLHTDWKRARQESQALERLPQVRLEWIGEGWLPKLQEIVSLYAGEHADLIPNERTPLY